MVALERDARELERGNALLSVIVALGLAGMIFAGISAGLGTAFKASASLSLDGDREALKQMLLTAVSCSDTVTAAACAQPIIELKRRHANGTVSTLATRTGAGTKFGKWTIRASCNATRDGIVVRAARLAPGGTLTSTSNTHFLPDPLSNKLVKWSSPESLLFGPGVEICALPAPDAALRKIATGIVSVGIRNDGSEFVEVNFTTNPPTVAGSRHMSAGSWRMNTPFDSTKPIYVSWGLRHHDVRVMYWNVSAMNSLTATYPGPGRVRFALASMGDIERAGNYWVPPSGPLAGPVKGSASFSITAYQH